MVAAHHGKVTLRVWEFALLNVLHPRPIHPYRNTVFGFAGDGTGVAADAPTVIDNESKISQEGSRRWSAKRKKV